MVRASTIRLGKELCPGYDLRRLRGKGGFGSVWEAVNEDGGLVAIKFLPCCDNSTAAQEIRSIQIVRHLRHPNLMRIDQVWCQRGYVGITMELADGSLQDLLDAYQLEFHTPLLPHDVCYYLSQVADVLDFINSRQHLIDGKKVAIQHCDIKPTNLLLYGERVKISDFGLASVTSTPVRSHRRAGTFAYSAPEVFQGRLSDWSDQFALAVSYCQLRGGRMPFPDPPRINLGSFVRPAPELSMLTTEEQQIIARALSPIPPDRWPTCREMMDQLSRVVK
ncbi:MAG TPA: serine/threonine-protein kinase [Gemmataceae bacterium]|nr:serine/threonine-protein kinase [Gemmataceae bacterium]